MKMWLEEEKTTYTASEDFKKNLEGGFRYVDKTELLIPLLDGEHETTFFLRPRRFGKTLTLSMIRRFVEDTRNEAVNTENRELFQGLKIMEAGERYTHQMTSYPVINITLQTVKGSTFGVAWPALRNLIRDLYNDKSYLLESEALTDTDKLYYRQILSGFDDQGKKISLADYQQSLKQLTYFLRKASGKRAVVLIDEYDVPLEHAYSKGYYPEMVSVIGPLLQNVLKTNSENLQFAVITGCLRIAKEGIYTGLNNPAVNTVLSHRGSDAIGFTEGEVRKLLQDSGVGDHFEQVREWYDGYRFGNTVIYNPWSVIQFIEDLNANPAAPPLTYWANTSGNVIIRELAERADEDTRAKIERAMQGEEISFPLRDNIVYNELYKDPDNVLNVMLSAGYLTAASFDGDMIQARIPNREVLKIYRDQISDWFRESVKTFDVRSLYWALEQGNAARAEQILTDEFMSAMSYYDTAEAFYHGVLLTLMQLNRNYLCKSNRESGMGRFDILAKQRTRWDLAFILEAKVSKAPTEMLSDARQGTKQITEKGYCAELQREGYEKIMTYSISFCEKRCRVVQGETFHLPPE
ncbi:MAG: AAA family ATPase [Clostridia bacterium]|nr:AAA family ATPase [Clostridia bacterium]